MAHEVLFGQKDRRLPLNYCDQQYFTFWRTRQSSTAELFIDHTIKHNLCLFLLSILSTRTFLVYALVQLKIDTVQSVSQWTFKVSLEI